MCQDAPTGVIVLNFCMRSVIADVITRAKFYVNRFMGFEVLRCRKFRVEKFRLLTTLHISETA